MRNLKEAEYRKLPFWGLSVSERGDFKRNDKPIKVRGYNEASGLRRTMSVVVASKGKRHRYNAARLVAMAWIDGYSDDKEIFFKDGNCHNIEACNLECLKPFRYNLMMGNRRGVKKDTIDTKRKKLKSIIFEANLTLAYYDKGDFLEINKHIEKDIIPELQRYCMVQYRLGKYRTTKIVSQVLSDLYAKIDEGCAMYSYEWWCKLQIRKLVKNGFGYSKTE